MAVVVGTVTSVVSAILPQAFHGLSHRLLRESRHASSHDLLRSAGRLEASGAQQV